MVRIKLHSSEAQFFSHTYKKPHFQPNEELLRQVQQKRAGSQKDDLFSQQNEILHIIFLAYLPQALIH